MAASSSRDFCIGTLNPKYCPARDRHSSGFSERRFSGLILEMTTMNQKSVLIG
jgi:hypothetical protein